MLWLTILNAAIWVFIGLQAPRGLLTLLGLVLWFIALVKAGAGSSQRISAGPTGLTVHLGLFGFPRVALARANIAHAEIINLPGTLFTGAAGVHWTRKRGWLLTPKLGPALRLHTAKGRRFTVSVRDPAAAMWALGFAQ
ncbi:hypothetical protein [Nocardia sp. NPDC051832]|uniref:hypothetical protein n=1 Tax=Nocardia sp. NPDC051832 TaxID=3155673 RepID=UPI003441607C